jgi:hypothetical protein
MKMEGQNITWQHDPHPHCFVFKFYFLICDSTTTIHGNLQQAFGDDAVSKAQAFSEGSSLVEDEQVTTQHV